MGDNATEKSRGSVTLASHAPIPQAKLLQKLAPSVQVNKENSAPNSVHTTATRGASRGLAVRSGDSSHSASGSHGLSATAPSKRSEISGTTLNHGHMRVEAHGKSQSSTQSAQEEQSSAQRVAPVDSNVKREMLTQQGTTVVTAAELQSKSEAVYNMLCTREPFSEDVGRWYDYLKPYCEKRSYGFDVLRCVLDMSLQSGKSEWLVNRQYFELWRFWALRLAPEDQYEAFKMIENYGIGLTCAALYSQLANLKLAKKDAHGAQKVIEHGLARNAEPRAELESFAEHIRKNFAVESKSAMSTSTSHHHSGSIRVASLAPQHSSTLPPIANPLPPSTPQHRLQRDCESTPSSHLTASTQGKPASALKPRSVSTPSIMSSGPNANGGSASTSSTSPTTMDVSPTGLANTPAQHQSSNSSATAQTSSAASAAVAAAAAKRRTGLGARLGMKGGAQRVPNNLTATANPATSITATPGASTPSPVNLNSLTAVPLGGKSSQTETPTSTRLTRSASTPAAVNMDVAPTVGKDENHLANGLAPIEEDCIMQVDEENHQAAEKPAHQPHHVSFASAPMVVTFAGGNTTNQMDLDPMTGGTKTSDYSAGSILSTSGVSAMTAGGRSSTGHFTTGSSTNMYSMNATSVSSSSSSSTSSSMATDKQLSSLAAQVPSIDVSQQRPASTAKVGNSPAIQAQPASQQAPKSSTLTRRAASTPDLIAANPQQQPQQVSSEKPILNVASAVQQQPQQMVNPQAAPQNRPQSVPPTTQPQSTILPPIPSASTVSATSDANTSTTSIEAATTAAKALGREVFLIKGRPYINLAAIGKGGTCCVYKVMDMNGNIWALKVITWTNDTIEVVSGYQREVALLESVQRSPYVVKLFDYELVATANTMYILFEFAETDLRRLFMPLKLDPSIAQVHPGGRFATDLDALRYYWRSMLSAVLVLHKARIVHLDLKPANFVLVEGRVKIIDFGIAKKVLNDTMHAKIDDIAGTILYMAPETLRDTSGRGAPHKVGFTADVWSMGCILYQMVFGFTPFEHVSGLMPKITAITSDAPIDIQPVDNEDLMDCLRACLDKNLKNRPTIEQLLNHPFLGGFVKWSQ